MAEPSMLLQRPASNPCQETSHIIVKVFRDLYADESIDEETVRNLTTSKRGKRCYHDKYVEKLQKVQKEYDKEINGVEAVMNHLKSAYEKAKISEEEEEAKEQEKYSNYEELGIPPVQSHLHHFLELELLEKECLITPTVLIGNEERDKQQTPIEADKIPRYTDATISSRMLFEKTLQEDNYYPEPGPILPENSNQGKARPKSNKKREPQNGKSKEEKNIWRHYANPYQREIDKKDIANLQKRADFLKNPRFADNIAENCNKDFFSATPSPVIFKSYEIGITYELKLELKNISSSSRQVRVLQPSSKYFSVDSGKFPDENGLVAPGMCCVYTVQFTPNSLADFDDELIIKTQAEEPLVVLLQGRRNPPNLNLPEIIDCGHSLVGSLKSININVINTGGEGRFSLNLTQEKDNDICWDELDMNNPCIIKSLPFTVYPDRFELQENQSIELKLTFEPKLVKFFNMRIKLSCDNCSVKYYSFKGCGELAHCKLGYFEGGLRMPLLGESFDETAPQIVSFDKTNPNNIYRKKFNVTNLSNVALKFHWDVKKPNLCDANEREITCGNVFAIQPKQEIFEAKSDGSFEVIFSPEMLGDFFEVASLILDDIPVSVGESQFELQEKEMIKFSIKAHTQENELRIQPSVIIIPGKCYIGLPYEKSFTVTNESVSDVTVAMKNMRTDTFMLTLLPAKLSLAPGEKQCVSLMITGYKEGIVEEFVQCKVPFSLQDYCLHVTAYFFGPELCFLENIIDFGLVRLDCYSNQCFTLKNISSIPAEWFLQVHDKAYESCFEFFPNEGTLYGDETLSIAVHFQSVEECTIHTFLECLVDDKVVCCIPIHVEIQKPSVCLETCQMNIDCCFVGVPVTGKVKLINNGLLETRYSWKSQAICDEKYNVCIEYDHQGGIIDKRQSLEVSIEMCFNCAGNAELILVCDIEEMLEPLLLSVNANVKGLDVDIELPPNSQQSESNTLEFGENCVLGDSVTSYILLINKTAINTTFNLFVEHFQETADIQSPANYFFPSGDVAFNSEEQHLKKEIEENLLSNGNGIAFLISEKKGTLEAYETKKIYITAISDMWGEYFETLHCEIGDLAERCIPVHIDVMGTPLSFQMSKEQPPVVRFGMHVNGSNVISRNMKINNSSHQEIRLDWQAYVLDGNDKGLVDLDVYIGDPFPVKSDNSVDEKLPVGESDVDNDEYVEEKQEKLFTVVLNEHQGIRCSNPFDVPRKQLVIPGKSSTDFHVIFKPMHEGTREKNFLGYALGYMSLKKKDRWHPGKYFRADGLDMLPFALNMTGSVKPARVFLDACDENGFSFELPASNLLDEAKTNSMDGLYCRKRFVLLNKTDALIQFRFAIEKPFSVEVTDSVGWKKKDSNQKKKSKNTEQIFSLKPRKNLQIHVTFELYENLLKDIDVNFADELVIRRPLTMQFTNKSKQDYELTANINLPVIRLSTHELDFGICHVSEKRELTLSISNPSKANLYWKIESDEDCPKACLDAFVIDKSHGMIIGERVDDVTVEKSRDVIGIEGSNEIAYSYTDIKIYFTAAHNVEYEMNLEVISLFDEKYLHKEPLKLLLRGVGSYDQAYKTQ